MKKFKQFYSANGAMIFKLTVTQVSMSVFSLIITIAMRCSSDSIGRAARAAVLTCKHSGHSLLLVSRTRLSLAERRA